MSISIIARFVIRKMIYNFRRSILSFKKGVYLKGNVSICARVKIIVEKGARLEIGNNVKLEHDTVVYCKKGSVVRIGNNTSTGHHTEISCNNSIDLGNDIIMSAFTYITDSNHRYDLKDVPIRSQGMSVGKTKVGSNVWLGRGAMILKDAEVGDHSVVGANSVVTKKFDGNSVLGGIPAVLVKKIG